MPVLRSAFSWGKIRLWPKTRVSRARLTTWARLPKSQLSEPVLDLPLVKIINTTITTKKWRKHRLFYCTDLKTHKMMFFSQKKNHYTTNTTSTKKQQLMIALEKPTIQQDSSIQGGKNAPFNSRSNIRWLRNDGVVWWASFFHFASYIQF